VDDHEADYLRRRNRELEGAVARWRAVALVACAAFVALAVAGGLGGVMLGQVWLRQDVAMAEAREAELVAREETERALQEEMAARQHAEFRQSGPVEHVAGGLGLAALDPRPAP
jgi:hypothetical protein